MPTPSTAFAHDQVRTAGLDDLPALRALAARALRRLGRCYYAAAQIEDFLAAESVPDAALLQAGALRVLVRQGRILAMGGWVARPAVAEPGTGRRVPGPPAAGVIRWVAVDPDHARTGLGQALVAHLEGEIRRAGHRRVEFEASMTAIPFATALGYWPGRPVVLGLAGAAVPLMGVVMAKPLFAEAAPPALAA